MCFCFRRRFRLAPSEPPEDIEPTFDDYSEKGVMGLDALRRFLVVVQRELSANVEDAQAVMDSLKELKDLDIFHQRGLDLEAFFSFLFGDINSPLYPELGILARNRDQNEEETWIALIGYLAGCISIKRPKEPGVCTLTCGLNPLCYTKVLSLGDCCLSSLCSKMHFELDTPLQRNA